MKKLIPVFLFVVFLAGDLYCEEKAAENKPEVKKTEETKKEKDKPPTTAEKVFFCAKGYNGPACLGWCKNGNYYGPVHMGNIGYVKTDNFYGLLQAGVLVVAENKFYGGMQTSLFSISNNFYGLIQLGGLVSVSMKNFYGLIQIGGLLSGSDNFNGFVSLSGVVSGTERFRGALQISLFSLSGFNFPSSFYSKENQEKFIKDKENYGFFGAFQIGVLVSGASTFKGISQIGAYNVSLQHYGGQIGIVNRSKVVRGVQIGIVNYTEKLYGFQLGLVNIAQNGFLPYTTILNIGW